LLDLLMILVVESGGYVLFGTCTETKLHSLMQQSF